MSKLGCDTFEKITFEMFWNVPFAKCDWQQNYFVTCYIHWSPGQEINWEWNYSVGKKKKNLEWNYSVGQKKENLEWNYSEGQKKEN